MPSTLLSANELADIRSATELLLPQSVIISALTEVSEGQGGFTQSWAASGTVDCRLVAKQGGERMLAGQIAATGSYMLTVPHDSTIAVDNRATVDGIAYRVLFIDAVKTWRAAIRCDCDLEVT